MTTQTIEAVYERGAFRLVQQPVVPFDEGQRVRLVVETESAPADVLRLATSVFDGLSEEDALEIEAIAQKRDQFFRQRP